jgi:N-acetylglucosamine kinase-like BadF-type ATPase
VSENLFLGVDGGGTKTHFVLIDHEGTTVALSEGPSSYHLQIGIDGLRDVLANGIAAACGRAGIRASEVAYAFFGIPAHGEDSALQPQLDALPGPLLGHSRYACGNDMVCAWAGSLAGADGINIVAGTGSGAYGEHRGKSARAGGWGELFGDEGSAYWIAVQGLNAFTRMSDGRLPRGPRYELFRSSFALTRDLDLCAKAMNAHTRTSLAALCAKAMNAHTRTSLAALAELVTRAAQVGDKVAARIFDEAARELAGIIEAVRHALEFEPRDRVPLSYSGGVFNAQALILEPLQRALAADARYDLRAPVLSPSLGAAIYAARLAGEPLSAAAIDRLTRTPSAIVGRAKPRFRP